MTAPPFNAPFDPGYDDVSMFHLDVPAHPGCYVYTPDNYDDYQCFALWQPAPELGAPEWTRNGQRILIGVYRDEGRAPARQPFTAMTWARTGATLTVTCSKAHHIQPGAVVDLADVNVLSATVTVNAVTDLTFQAAIEDVGALSGTGAYSPEQLVDFAESYVVFRLLPLFKPVSISTVYAILAGANPEQARTTVTLTDIQSGATQQAASLQAKTTSILYRRHRQQLDELQRPLRQLYDARGRVIQPGLRFSKRANAQLYVNVPMVTQHDPLPTANTHLPAHDYYGFSLNNVNRGPFYRSDIVYYDSNAVLGINRYVNNGAVVYAGNIHDVFGDFVVGARSNNTLVTRKPVQPLLVDQHNTPYKRPIGKG